MNTFVLTKSHKTFCVPLYDMLYSILIFKDSFDKFMLKRKSMLLVININTHLSQISLEIHKYNSDSDVILSFLKLSM